MAANTLKRVCLRQVWQSSSAQLSKHPVDGPAQPASRPWPGTGRPGHQQSGRGSESQGHGDLASHLTLKIHRVTLAKQQNQLLNPLNLS